MRSFGVLAALACLALSSAAPVNAATSPVNQSTAQSQSGPPTGHECERRKETPTS
ncbi:MAG: hypothetical protein VYD64_00170 [Pseudomonadota bacterium]|nr:hypothetical protein [Pseudomonadota bacterium]